MAQENFKELRIPRDVLAKFAKTIEDVKNPSKILKAIEIGRGLEDNGTIVDVKIDEDDKFLVTILLDETNTREVYVYENKGKKFEKYTDKS